MMTRRSGSRFRNVKSGIVQSKLEIRKLYFILNNKLRDLKIGWNKLIRYIHSEQTIV